MTHPKLNAASSLFEMHNEASQEMVTVLLLQVPRKYKKLKWCIYSPEEIDQMLQETCAMSCVTGLLILLLPTNLY